MFDALFFLKEISFRHKCLLTHLTSLSRPIKKKFETFFFNTFVDISAQIWLYVVFVNLLFWFITLKI